MDSKTFFDNFETIANAPGGVARLRELILDLAVLGKLVPQTSDREECLLGEITKIRTGKLDANASSSDGRYPFFTCARDPLRIESFSYDTECVLLAGNGNFDVNYYSGKFDAYQRTYIIEALEEKQLFVPFLFRFMQGHSKKLLDQAIGGVIRYIKIGFLTQAPFLLPSLEEQKRIVAKVDELMTLCDEFEAAQTQRNSIRMSARKSAIDSISTATTSDELNAAWKRISDNWLTIADTPESIASLRSLILDLAVRGSLDTSEGDVDQFPISVELEKLKLDKDKLWNLSTALPGPAQGWSRVPMARLGHWGSGGTPTASRKEFYQNGTIPWAVIGDLNNSIMLMTESLITKKALESSSTKMIPIGAVLVAMYGASIGKSAVSGIECCTNQAIAHCVVDEDVITREYMFLVIKSLKNHLIDMGKGAAQPNISQSVLKHLVIDIPPLRIQKKVIERIDELLDLCNQIEISLSQRLSLEESIAKTMTRTVAA